LLRRPNISYAALMSLVGGVYVNPDVSPETLAEL
jgi:hypothetical protein